MKPRGFILNAAIVTGTLGLAGCGVNEVEKARADKSRAQLEEKTRRETEAANKAVSDLNRKLFAKPPATQPPAPPPAAGKP